MSEPKIWVDDLRKAAGKSTNWKWQESCHMFMLEPCKDSGLDPLHEMAARLGLKREWFQYCEGSVPHYDLTASKRKQAFKLGAYSASRKDLLKAIQLWRAAGPK